MNAHFEKFEKCAGYLEEEIVFISSRMVWFFLFFFWIHVFVNFFLFKFFQNWDGILNSVLNPTFKNEHYYENLLLVFM